MKASLLIVGMLVGCGPKKDPAPVRPLPDNATTPVPGSATGTTAHLMCNGINRAPCQAPDFAFDANYDTPSLCRVNGNNNNEFTFDMRTNKPASNERFFVAIKNFRGAGTYELNTADEFVSLTATIDRPASQCGPASKSDAALRNAKYSCQACQVVVTDANPSAPYPKPLTLSVTCTDLCQEDAYKCGGINMQLTQTCTQ